MRQESIERQLSKLGLSIVDIDGQVSSDQDIISEITGSGRLYRKSLRHILLNWIKEYLGDPSIKPSDLLVSFFHSKDRRSDWNAFRECLMLKIPGLKLTRMARVILFSFIFVFAYLSIGLFSEHFDFIIAWKLSGFSLFPILVLFLVPLGMTLTYGTNRLPVKTIEALIERIMDLNNIDLLTDDRAFLKRILEQELQK